MTEIIRTKIGVTTYLTPSGPVSEKDDFGALAAAFEECLNEGTKNVVLAVERVPSMTGEVLEFLLDQQDRLIGRRGQLTILKPNALLKDIFRITDFDKYVEVKESLEAKFNQK